MFSSQHHTSESCVKHHVARQKNKAALGCLHPLCFAINMAICGFAVGAEAPAAVASESFNTLFLEGSSAVDLQPLLNANSVLPGQYRVDVFSNGTLVGRRDIDFAANPVNGKVEPRITLELLQQLGVDMRKLREQGLVDEQHPADHYDLPAMIEQASLNFDANRLRLNISVPQVAMARGMRGYVDPELWDQGVAAGFINYQLSSTRSKTDYTTQISNNLGLRNGINFGAWRLRNESNLSSSTGRPNRFVSNRTFIQRDLTAIKGQLSAGEIFSDSDLFDSVRYQGVKIASDEGMRADSERGYAPIIRGVAETNAKIEVRQDNYILYTTNVPPGPFEISDIYPSGSNGDLEITIVEADGRRKVTRQAFSALPTMVREGQLKYSLSSGKFNNNSEGYDKPAFLGGTFAYGLTSNLTGIAGIQASNGFKALSIGAAKNTSIGAMSLDVTQSSSKAFGKTTQGSSVRALYAKTFTGTDTSFTLAAYRYSTEGYRTLTDHVQDTSAGATRRAGNAKTRTDLTVNQTLGEARQFGSLYLNASDQRYWDRGGSRSFSAGYNNNWRDLNYNISLSKTQEFGARGDTSNDTQLSVSISFPLGSTPRAPRAYVSSNHQNAGTSTQAGINGYLTEDSDTYYSVQTGRSVQGERSGSLSLSTRTSMGDLGFGYNRGSGYESQNLSAAGSIVAHAGGINMGQTVGETFGLVEVPGMSGVEVSSYSGVKTGLNGYAVLPNAQPYRVNWVTLDTRNLGGEIELDNATQQLVPRRGSVVLARFEGSKGRRVQFELYDANGQPIPFGAMLLDSDGKQLALSDPTGKALALVTKDHGVITIKWQGKSCPVPYKLPEKVEGLNYEQYRLACASSAK